MKEANARVVCCLHEFVPAFTLVQAPLHVGLSGSNPHITNQDVFQNDGVFPLDCHLVGFAAIGFQGGQIDVPSAVLVGGCRKVA